MRSPHVCPNCGERVSAFAAGCALCGAELDPRRSQRPRSLTERVRALFVPLRHRVRTRPRAR